MLTLVLPILSLVAALAAALGCFFIWRQSRRLRAELAQCALEIEVLHEKLNHGYDSFTSKLAKGVAHQEQVAQKLADLEDRFNRVEMHAGLCVPPKPAASGFNINKRVEVVRLFQEGYPEHKIAEQLAVPLGEVRLLIYLEKSQAASPTKMHKARVAADHHAA